MSEIIDATAVAAGSEIGLVRVELRKLQPEDRILMLNDVAAGHRGCLRRAHGFSALLAFLEQALERTESERLALVAELRLSGAAS